MYILNDAVSILDVEQSDIWKSLNWNIYENYRAIENVNSNESVAEIVEKIFNDKTIKFIQEICTQDIVHNEKLIKEISYILSRIRTAIIMDSKGEEEVLRLLTTDKTIRCQYDTKIEKKFEREYSKWGALIRNRVFKQKDNYKKISDKVKIEYINEFLLDYRYEKNACQSALLHIINEEKSSCGTGFVISSDGYAPQCGQYLSEFTNDL